MKTSVSKKRPQQQTLHGFFGPKIVSNVAKPARISSQDNESKRKYQGSPESALSNVKRSCASPMKSIENQTKPSSAHLTSPLKRELAEIESCFLGDDFDIEHFEEKVNLSKLDRYEALHVQKLDNGDLKLTVKSLSKFENKGVCYIKSPWNKCLLRQGDKISLKGTKTDTTWCVDWDGILVSDADRLLSNTMIVSSLYCSRKAILSEIFEERGDSKCLIIGCIVHELLQEVLWRKCSSYKDIESVFKEITESKGFTLKLFLEKMDYEETISSITSYLPSIYDFIANYVSSSQTNTQLEHDCFDGKITRVVDIEENIWSPVLGIKGKIDATVRVRVKNEIKTMPLELKSGKPSFSFEHRGQVILYCLLLKQLGESVSSGLLLYLKNGIIMKEIQAAEREIRDLTLLRNNLVHWLNEAENVKASQMILPPDLPPPINRSTCQSCSHLIACSSALRYSGFENLDKNNILRDVGPEATSHLSDEHLNYIFHLIGLQSLRANLRPGVSAIWSTPPEKRETNGRCLSFMKADFNTVSKNGRTEVTFRKMKSDSHKIIFETGQSIIVSNDARVAVTIGFISSISTISVCLLVDRFVKLTDPPYHLDLYDTSLDMKVRTNVGLLLDNSPRAQSLRESIIDKKIPSFTTKLSSKIKALGKDVFDELNKEQVRAVLQALSSERYLLIKGMPGTGKTKTLRALIVILVRLGCRVLVTSLTHSAVDNILVGLIGKVKILRIGSDKRIICELSQCTESALIDKIKTPTITAIEEAYKKIEVVGVTCHGSNNSWLRRVDFDFCIVDEATQVTQVQVLRPLFLAKRFILVGDPKQLPPLVLSKEAKTYGLGTSLFQRLDRPAVTSLLTRQYRMNQTINDLANCFAYEGLLNCGSDLVANATVKHTVHSAHDVPQWKKKVLSTKLEDSVVVIHVESTDKTVLNETEAKVVMEIVNEFEKVGIGGSSIGVIATYREQVSLLKSLSTKNIEINTVDQYQGRDKEIILFSATRSTAISETDNSILTDKNRLTVAITRSKKKLILVCNVKILKGSDNFKKLFASISDDCFVTFV